MKIQHKFAAIIFVFGGLFMLFYTTSFVSHDKGEHIEAAFLMLQAKAKEKTEIIDRILLEMAQVTKTLAEAPLITEKLNRSNAALAGLDQEARDREINKLNDTWMKSKAGDPFVLQYTKAPIAQHLNKHMKNNPGRYGEIFITNRYGTIIASTGKLTTLAHSHKYWWKAAWHGGKGRIFFDDRGYDTSAEGYVIGVVAPVKSDGKIIGIIKANVNISGPLKKFVDSFSYQNSGQMKIVRSGGSVVLERDKAPLSGKASGPLASLLKKRDSGVIELIERGEHMFYAFAPVGLTMGSERYGFGGSYESIDHIMGNRGEGWLTVISADKQDALAAAPGHTGDLTVMGALLVLVMGVAALLFGARLARPIVSMERHASRIGAMDFSPIDIRSNDELGSLGRSMNRMAEKLKATTISRDMLVEENEKRRLAEKQIVKSEAQYRSLVENSPDAIVEIDAEGTIVFANNVIPAFRDKSVTGKNIYSFIPEDQISAMKVAINNAFVTGEICEFETYVKRPGMETMWRNRVIPLEKKGETPRFLLIATNVTESKLAERKFRSLFEQANDSIFIIDPQTRRFLDVNENAARSLGYAKHELLLKTIDDIVPAGSPQFIGERIEELIKTGRIVLEHTHIRKDGSEFPVEVRGQKVEFGGKMAIQCVVRDITEMKIAEQERHLNELRMQTLLKLGEMTDAPLAQMAGFILDNGVRLTQSAMGFFGFLNEDESVFTAHSWSRGAMEEDELAGEPFEFCIATSGLWAESVRQRKAMIFNDYGATDTPGQDALRNRTPIKRLISVPVFEGSKIVALAAMANKEDEYNEADLRQVQLLLEGIWRILQHKKAEEERAKIARAIEQTSESVLITDTGGIIQYVNPAFERLSGYQKDELVGQNPNILKSGKHDAVFYENLWETISKGEMWTGIITNRNKNGEHFIEEASIFPIVDANGDVSNYAAVKRNITHEIELEREIRQAQKLNAIGTLAGGIAHDFNNILMPILGYAEMLKAQTPAGSEQRSNLNEIVKAARRARDLISQILTFSRRSEREFQPIEAYLIVREALKLMRATIPVTIGIVENIDDRSGAVLGDTTQIHQIIINLCSNAAYSMKDRGGTLKVELNAVSGKAIPGLPEGSSPKGKYLRISVMDTGLGMDQDTLGRVFDPFFTTKPEGEGVGMGLAVVHGIVKNHNGYIHIDSDPGAGTTVTVYLPQYDAKITERKKKRISPLKGAGRIMVVDDEEAVAKTTGKMLMSFGYDVIVTTDSVMALEMVRQDPAAMDLVVTDITMPKMTGYELARELMAISPGLPVVTMTGYHCSSHPEMAAAAGIKASLNKPITPNELFAEVSALINNGSNGHMHRNCA